MPSNEDTKFQKGSPHKESPEVTYKRTQVDSGSGAKWWYWKFQGHRGRSWYWCRGRRSYIQIHINISIRLNDLPFRALRFLINATDGIHAIVILIAELKLAILDLSPFPSGSIKNKIVSYEPDGKEKYNLSYKSGICTAQESSHSNTISSSALMRRANRVNESLDEEDQKEEIVWLWSRWIRAQIGFRFNLNSGRLRQRIFIATIHNNPNVPRRDSPLPFFTTTATSRPLSPLRSRVSSDPPSSMIHTIALHVVSAFRVCYTRLGLRSTYMMKRRYEDKLGTGWATLSISNLSVQFDINGWNNEYGGEFGEMVDEDRGEKGKTDMASL
ncbi:hypothetical protein C8J55DRAFT_488612 [Lentinula edodes]|uniref:Uncharacterized protein n=1 Tax=Lentinula lateritia TaxID=40482 RepID=A0A9W9DQX2_9AGAR|nr:hypothetical protein C8J55DRAFT_488612 [Lentinula edodes]